jgi:hypothetical protein
VHFWVIEDILFIVSKCRVVSAGSSNLTRRRANMQGEQRPPPPNPHNVPEGSPGGSQLNPDPKQVLVSSVEIRQGSQDILRNDST